jgi:hypothetical protein
VYEIAARISNLPEGSKSAPHVIRKLQFCGPKVTLSFEPLIDGQLSGRRPVVGTDMVEPVVVVLDPDVIVMVVVDMALELDLESFSSVELD